MGTIMLPAADRDRRVESIFRSLDPAGHGALEKVVLEQLAARLNPDMSFSQFHLAVIADEICNCYSKHYAEGRGLTLEGLQQLYEDNPESLARDFELLAPGAASPPHGSRPVIPAAPAVAASTPSEHEGSTAPSPPEHQSPTAAALPASGAEAAALGEDPVPAGSASSESAPAPPSGQHSAIGAVASPLWNVDGQGASPAAALSSPVEAVQPVADSVRSGDSAQSVADSVLFVDPAQPVADSVLFVDPAQPAADCVRSADSAQPAASLSSPVEAVQPVADSVRSGDSAQPAASLSSSESLPVKRLDFSGAEEPRASPQKSDSTRSIASPAVADSSRSTASPEAAASTHSIDSPAVADSVRSTSSTRSIGNTRGISSIRGVKSLTVMDSMRSIGSKHGISSVTVMDRLLSAARSTPSGSPPLSHSSGEANSAGRSPPSPPSAGGSVSKPTTGGRLLNAFTFGLLKSTSPKWGKWSAKRRGSRSPPEGPAAGSSTPGAAAAAQPGPGLLTPAATSSASGRSHSGPLPGTPEMRATDMVAAYVDSVVAASGGMAAGTGCSAGAAPADAAHALRGSTPLPVLEPDDEDAGGLFSFPGTASTPGGRGEPAATPAQAGSGGQTPEDFTFSRVARPEGTPRSVSPDWAPLQTNSKQRPVPQSQESPPAAASAPEVTSLMQRQAPQAQGGPPAAACAPGELEAGPAERFQGLGSAEKLQARLASLGPSPAPGMVRELLGEAGRLPVSKTAAVHLDMAARLLDEDLPWLAAERLKAALAGHEDQRALFRLGGTLFGLQQYSLARHAYVSALQVLPAEAGDSLRPKILLNLGISLEAEGCLQQACDSYRAALELNPSHSRLHKLLGSALFAARDLPAAEAALRQSLAMNPGYADAWCDLGVTLSAAGRPREARWALAKALALEPAHVEALFNLGNLHRQHAGFQEALRCYDVALLADSRHWRSLLNRSVTLLCLEQHAEADAALQAAMRLAGPGGALQDEIKRLKQIAANTRY